MAKLLFDLRNVPDDEADEVRDLLAQNEIPFYETRPSVWGLFAGALWVPQDELLAPAKALLAQYQLERRTRARADYDAARASGQAEGFMTSLLREPTKVLLMLATILFLVGLTVLPFLLLGDAPSAR